MRRYCALGLAILIAAAPARAHADEAPALVDAPPETSSSISARRRAAALAVAIVPGFVVHGLGAWTVGEKPAARTLLAGEAIGFGLAGMAGVLVGGSGGNPYTVVPAVPLVVGGVGMFVQSWLTDIYVAAGGQQLAAPPRGIAPWSVEAGTGWLHDAYRDYAFVRGGGRVELGRVDLEGATLVDAKGNAQVGEADVRVRLFGAPARGGTVEDGSRLAVRLGGRLHRDTNDRVTQVGGELAIDGRLDLHRVDQAFGRSFAELGAGIGLVHAEYSEVAGDVSSVLLARFAWGVYLGSRGEASLFYDHTRDGLVGGIYASRASGFIGSFGASLDVRVHGPWAVRAGLEIGTAYFTTFALAYRGGPS